MKKKWKQQWKFEKYDLCGHNKWWSFSSRKLPDKKFMLLNIWFRPQISINIWRMDIHINITVLQNHCQINRTEEWWNAVKFNMLLNYLLQFSFLLNWTVTNWTPKTSALHEMHYFQLLFLYCLSWEETSLIHLQENKIAWNNLTII